MPLTTSHEQLLYHLFSVLECRAHVGHWFYLPESPRLLGCRCVPPYLLPVSDIVLVITVASVIRTIFSTIIYFSTNSTAVPFITTYLLLTWNLRNVLCFIFVYNYFHFLPYILRCFDYSQSERCDATVLLCLLSRE